MTRSDWWLLAATILAVIALALVGAHIHPVKGDARLPQDSPRPAHHGAASRSLPRLPLPASTGESVLAQGATFGAPQTAVPFRPAPKLSRPALVAEPSSPSAARAAGSQLRSGAQSSAETIQQVPTPPETADNGAGPSSGEAAGPAPTIADAHGTIKQRIAYCESRGQLDAVNPRSGASGAWQFLDTTFEAVTGLPGKASDYGIDVQSAAFDALYAAQGTRPWNASRSCWGGA